MRPAIQTRSANRNRPRFAVIALAGVLIAGGWPARAGVSEHLEFSFKNNISETVRGTIANQGAVITVKPTWTELLTSYFAAGSFSEAYHVVRFVPEKAAGPTYCEWVVHIQYIPSQQRKWQCDVHHKLTESGYQCAGSGIGSSSLPCDFRFYLSKAKSP